MGHLDPLPGGPAGKQVSQRTRDRERRCICKLP